MKKVIRFAANFNLFVIMLYFGLLSAWYFAYSCDFFYPVTYQILHAEDSYASDLPDSAGIYTRFRFAGAGKHLSIFEQILQKVEKSTTDFSDVTFRVDKKTYPVVTDCEGRQINTVTKVMDTYKFMNVPFVILLSMVVSIMILYEIQPYRWYYFTKWMSVVFIAAVFMVWLIGVQNFFDILCAVSNRRDCDWFFLDRKSLLGVVLPYPGAYISFIAVIAVSGLAFWAVLYAAASKFIKFFIDKNYL